MESRLFALLLLVPLFTAHSGPLEMFKWLTDGSIPIYKAEVERDVILSDGKVSSPTFFSMGWASDGGSNTWFYSPIYSREDRRNLEPGSPIFGQSLTHIWFFTDTHVQVSEISVASGSWPEEHGEPKRSDCAFSATLGLDDSTVLTWSELSFTGSKLSPEGPLRKGQIMKLDSLGRPVLVHASDRTNTYEYSGTNWIPSVIISRRGLASLRFRLLSFQTNAINIASDGGYTPSMFLGPSASRSVYFWTNSESFGVSAETGRTWANRENVTKSNSPFWILVLITITALASVTGWWWKSVSENSK